MTKVFIMPNVMRDSGFLYTQQIIGILKKINIDIFLPDFLYGELSYLGTKFCSISTLDEQFAMVITLGGDGTILSVSHEILGDIPILGLNTGHLGFLTELERKELTALHDIFINKAYKIDRRMMLEADLTRHMCEKKFPALNDVVISRKNSGRLLSFEIFADGEFMDRHSADGVVISTPTGSTAYSLSVGGPIVDPAMELMIITPICPHSLHSRSEIVSAHKKIDISIKGFESAVVIVDGKTAADVSGDGYISVSKSSKKVNLVRMLDYSFYDDLRRKLIQRT